MSVIDIFKNSLKILRLEPPHLIALLSDLSGPPAPTAQEEKVSERVIRDPSGSQESLLYMGVSIRSAFRLTGASYDCMKRSFGGKAEEKQSLRHISEFPFGRTGGTADPSGPHTGRNDSHIWQRYWPATRWVLFSLAASLHIICGHIVDDSSTMYLKHHLIGFFLWFITSNRVSKDSDSGLLGSLNVVISAEWHYAWSSGQRGCSGSRETIHHKGKTLNRDLLTDRSDSESSLCWSLRHYEKLEQHLYKHTASMVCLELVFFRTGVSLWSNMNTYSVEMNNFFCDHQKVLTDWWQDFLWKTVIKASWKIFYHLNTTRLLPWHWNIT